MTKKKPSKPFTGGEVHGSNDSTADEFWNRIKPENFYLHSKDADGHSRTIRWNVGRVSDYLLAEVGTWVDHLGTPYTNITDFTRDSLVHRCVTLRDFEATGFMPGPWSEFAERDRMALEVEMYTTQIDAYRQNIQLARSTGNLDWYREIVKNATSATKKMPSPHKEALLTILKSEQDVRYINPS